MEKLFTAMILVSMIPIVVMVEVNMTEYHIDGRAGCTYESKCCMNTLYKATMNWYNIGGGHPLKNSSNILITEDNNGSGSMYCKTIKFQPACEGIREFTCTGILRKSHKFSSRNLRVQIPVGSKPQTIKVLGGTQKNTTNRTSIEVACEVESCLSSTEYSVRFRDHNGKIKKSTELMNRTSFNASITIDVNETDTYPHVYTCELLNSRNELLDSATFTLNGTVNPHVQLSGSGHIDGRIGCTYERTCCAESRSVDLKWYPIGGGNPISNSRHIGIKESVGNEFDSEPKQCITIIVPSKHKGLQEFTCFGHIEENNFFSTVNLRINTTSDRAQMITLTQTEIVGYIGENITVTGRVESCLSSIYKVQCFCQKGENDTEISSTNFIDCPTYNFSFPIKLNSSDNHCNVTIVNEHGEVQDLKSFRIIGCPFQGQRYFNACRGECVPCTGTCEDTSPDCTRECHSGCGCPTGTVLDEQNKQCIHSRNCSRKCEYEGEVYEPGDRWDCFNSGKCMKCRCLANGNVDNHTIGCPGCTKSLCEGSLGTICSYSNVTTICKACYHANDDVEVPGKCGQIKPCGRNPSQSQHCLKKWAICLNRRNPTRGRTTGTFRCSIPT